MEHWFLPLITLIAAAFGGIIGSVIKLKSEERRYLFGLKVDAYKNLIASYRKITSSDSNELYYKKYQQEYVQAQEQVELIGNMEVVNISKSFYDADPARSPEIQKQLIKAMRNDLQHNRKF
jgi:hypothetical protein